MFSFGRLLLRLIVVPVALMLAICAAVLVAFMANWNWLLANVGSDAPDGGLGAGVVVGFILLIVVSASIIWMLMPALIGVLIAEAFSIRSWLFHALNGALSIWVGRAILAPGELPFEVHDRPLLVLAAGLGAGFTYWAVAGWNAGVMKPAPAASAGAARRT